ncbi:hydroxymethylglutaryl-coenzyme A reductase-domain-containing protein [Aspergillus aurantiobrunneus]
MPASTQHRQRNSQGNASGFRENAMLIPQKLSWIASASPVHTVVLVSLLVSSVYVALLENSLFDSSGNRHVLPSLSSAGKSLQFHTSGQAGWQWQSGLDTGSDAAVDHRAIVTFQFSQASSSDTPNIAFPDHLSVEPLPPSPDSFFVTSQGQSLAFSVAQRDVPEFLESAREFPVAESLADEPGKYRWVIQQQGSSRRGMAAVACDKWTELVRLFNLASRIDIVIMTVAYLSMHLTFGSLFVSMYRMGSRFWLFAAVLLSSTFAFVFALFTTTRLGVPSNLALLSEGLPFLVVTIGFENPIRLTQAVLSRATLSGEPAGSQRETATNPQAGIIQTAIQTSIIEEGPSIVKHYAVEIAVLIAGTLFSLDPALRRFCFLAAWILFFDCLLLFSFYTAILSIKLEIIRIQTSGKEYLSKGREGAFMTGFGQRLPRTHIRKFKLGMITAFILVNVLNMHMIPFRAMTASSSPSLWSRPSEPVVASKGLEAILNRAMLNDQVTTVTVLPPIRFQLENVALSSNDGSSRHGVGNLLRTLEDPVLSKCVLVALIISVGLNSRLFAAARNSVKHSNQVDERENSQSPAPSQLVPRKQVEKPKLPSAPPPMQSPVSVLSSPNRSNEQCQEMLREGHAQELTDEEIVTLSLSGNLPLHALEKTLKDFTRAVKIRRSIVSRTAITSDLTTSLEVSDLPYQQYDWSRVFGVCCENVVGYMPVPVGLAGPLTIDNRNYFLPMATTEGVLVAGVMRGSKAINAGGGVQTVLTADGMTRGPCVAFESLDRTALAKQWLDSAAGQEIMETAFNSTTRYGRLQSMTSVMAGTSLYIRFKASTGDAMGMNMISKGVEHALATMRENGFQDMEILSLSANYCSDKKPAAINWIEGRGKSVVALATIPPEIVRSVLKTDVNSMVALNIDKNLIGSAMAGSVGGFNAHAANIVAAMYIATGQDPAQVVESANCITVMKNVRGSLQVSVSMPSIEVGTIGGGTTLGPQRAMLDVLGVRGANSDDPGANSRSLARIIAAGVLAAELSLCAALAAGHLVKAHMQHNRAQ